MRAAKPVKTEDQPVASVSRSTSCAILLDAEGGIVDKSTTAGPLQKIWECAPPALVAAVESVRRDLTPLEQAVKNVSGQKMWVTIAPQGQHMLLVARDTELVEKMAEALLESRILLKGLLDSAVDLSFEVDPNGIFRFVSPANAFGQQADKWNGKPASEIFWPGGNVPARNPFLTTEKQTFESITIEIEHDRKRHVAMMVEPSPAPEGTGAGVRGTCRDITARIEKERITRGDHLRIGVQQRITKILNGSEKAQELLELASRELIDVLRADLVWSVMKYENGLVPVALCGERTDVLDLEAIWRELALSSGGAHQVKGGGREYLALRLERGGHGIGMVIVGRDTAVSPWSEQEKKLLDDVGDVLTAAFSKAELIDRLYRLSGKDELTDLLNRRAFREVVERRLKHQCRTKHAGCLVFIDLDNFKEVNDTLGHKAGDEAIQLVAEKMQGIIRASDYAGRFGGDEFVLWIEDADEDTAARKAQALLDYMPEVRAKIGNPELRLAASAGICRSRPGKDLLLAELADRADAALYEVKKSGKNSIAYAAAVDDEEGDQEPC